MHGKLITNRLSIKERIILRVLHLWCDTAYLSIGLIATLLLPPFFFLLYACFFFY